MSSFPPSSGARPQPFDADEWALLRDPDSLCTYAGETQDMFDRVVTDDDKICLSMRFLFVLTHAWMLSLPKRFRKGFLEMKTKTMRKYKNFNERYCLLNKFYKEYSDKACKAIVYTILAHEGAGGSLGDKHSRTTSASRSEEYFASLFTPKNGSFVRPLRSLFDLLYDTTFLKAKNFYRSTVISVVRKRIVHEISQYYSIVRVAKGKAGYLIDRFIKTEKLELNAMADCESYADISIPGTPAYPALSREASVQPSAPVTPAISREPSVQPRGERDDTPHPGTARYENDTDDEDEEAILPELAPTTDEDRNGPARRTERTVKKRVMFNPASHAWGARGGPALV